MRRLFAVAAVLAVFAGAGFCGASSFAEIIAAEPSVRANGMGNAYTAANDDVFGAYYNPAQTVNAAKVGFVFQRGYADDNTGAIALAIPIGAFKFGLSTLYYNAGSMDLYSANGFMGSVKAEQDYVGMASLSCKIGGVLSLGVNGKYVREQLFESVSASGITGDVGALLELPFISLGAAAQNITGGLDFGNGKENFRRTMRAGAYEHFGGDALAVSLALDAVKTDNEDVYKRAGAEVSIIKLLALRGGYEFGGDTASKSGGASLGLGVRLGAFALDYALVPNTDLGATQKAGLTINF